MFEWEDQGLSDLSCVGCKSRFPNLREQVLFHGQGPLCKKCLDAEKAHYADCKLDERKDKHYEGKTIHKEQEKPKEAKTLS